MSLEFIMRVKGVYSLSDLKRMDYITYFRLLDEAEQQEMEAIKRMEAQANEAR